MKSFIFLLVPFIIYSQEYNYIYGLEFPSNTEHPSDAMVAFKFDSPQDDGMPIFGPSNHGCTYIWEYYPYYQIGYYSVVWYSNLGAAYWNDGHADYYWGCNPWPDDGTYGLDHYWEMAGANTDADNSYARDLNHSPVIYNTSYKQAFRVIDNGDGSRTCIFYTDLSDTSNNKVIEVKSDAAFDNVLPPITAITWGENPWWNIHGHERLNGILGRIKIIDTVLTGSDIISEANDMTQLITGKAQRNIWWGITNFEHVDSLRSDYGTGRLFHWAGNDKAIIIAIDSVLVYDRPIAVDDNFVTPEGTEIILDILANDIDVDNKIDPSTVMMTSIPTYGTVPGVNSITGAVTYLPNSNFNGIDGFTYTVSDDSGSVSNEATVKITVLSGISDIYSGIPREHVLFQNYPNPFNPSTKIKFGLPKAEHVRIFVYNILGQKIRTLLDGQKLPGYYVLEFNAVDLPSGIYFLKIETKEFQKVNKMILLK